jgi:hypothetical protein
MQLYSVGARSDEFAEGLLPLAAQLDSSRSKYILSNIQASN